MIKKINSFLFFIFLVTIFSPCVFAQEKKENKFAIGTNIFSLAEPHTGVGVCASYRINKKVAVWSEFTYFFNSKYIINNWKNFKGSRIIFQPRYYINVRKFSFLALEFRLKTSDFNSNLNYYNKVTNDTLFNFPTSENQKIIAGALLVGKEIKISDRVFAELTFGFGARIRKIKRDNVPLGYEYKDLGYRGANGGPRFWKEEYFERDNGTAWYIPVGLRFFYKL